MLHPVKHYKTAKQKKSKSLVSNIAMNPFVLVAIAAALAMAVFLVIAYLSGFFETLKINCICRELFGVPRTRATGI